MGTEEDRDVTKEEFETAKIRGRELLDKILGFCEKDQAFKDASMLEMMFVAVGLFAQVLEVSETPPVQAVALLCRHLKIGVLCGTDPGEVNPSQMN